MGTKFFNKPGQISGSGMNMEARAIGASAYGGRQAAGGAAKDIGAAKSIGMNKQPLQKSQRSAAYPPGPKKV